VSERKISGRRIAVVLGVVCVILVAGVVETAAATNRLPQMNRNRLMSSLISQISALRKEVASLEAQINDTQSWSEGVFNFNLTKGANTQFNISTGGFRTATISISSYCDNSTVYRVFIGFITANQTLSDQQYTVQTFSTFFPGLPRPPLQPWFWTAYYAQATGFTQTYNVSFSKITVWIWDNSTTSRINGGVYYYLTK